jgi:protein-tyrosine phosphatase
VTAPPDFPPKYRVGNAPGFARGCPSRGDRDPLRFPVENNKFLARSCIALWLPSQFPGAPLSARVVNNFVDLHAHYLPALDDGATNRDMSMQMIRAVAALGFTDLYATPHQRSGMFMPAREAIATAFASVSADVAATGPAVRLGLGAENFWDDVLHGRIQDGTIPAYGGGPAFLFEVHPQIMPAGLENELFQLRVAGKLPVMAHPERYVAIQRDMDLAERLGRHAVLMVDLGALDGAHGRAEMKTARKLVQEGLAHAAATDIHRPDDEKGIAAGIGWIRKQFGPDVLEQMLAENTRRLLGGEMPEAPLAT